MVALPLREVPTESKARTIGEQLRSMVDRLEIGSRIPGERVLAAELGVARMTARRAIDTLVAEGRLERRHGSGTYVTPVPDATTSGLSSFTERMRGLGRIPSTTVLTMNHDTADDHIAGILGIEPGTPIITFTRLRHADDAPVAIETTWMPADVAPDLDEDDLAGSLFDVLETTYGTVVTEATSTIDAICPGTGAANHLSLDPDEACLRVRMRYLDHRRRVVMAASCVYRGDAYNLQVTLTRNALTRLGGLD